MLEFFISVAYTGGQMLNLVSDSIESLGGQHNFEFASVSVFLGLCARQGFLHSTSHNFFILSHFSPK